MYLFFDIYKEVKAQIKNKSANKRKSTIKTRWPGRQDGIHL